MSKLSRMPVCPHCRFATISGKVLRWSSRESPATCPACQKLSHVAASSSSGIGMLTLVFVLISLAGELVSPWWILAGGCLTAAYNLWAWQQVELFPTTAESVKNSRTAGWWASVLTFLAMLLS